MAVVILLLLGAGFWYWRSTFTEDTDDAQVDGDIYSISSKIAGQVSAVYVGGGMWKVEKGQLLVEIDPRDQQVALEQAQAQLVSAQADYKPGGRQRADHECFYRNDLAELGRGRACEPDLGWRRRSSRLRPPPRGWMKRRRTRSRRRRTWSATLRWSRRDVISKQQYDAAVASAASANAQVIEDENTLVAQQTAITNAQQRGGNIAEPAA